MNCNSSNFTGIFVEFKFPYLTISFNNIMLAITVDLDFNPLSYIQKECDVSKIWFDLFPFSSERAWGEQTQLGPFREIISVTGILNLALSNRASWTVSSYISPEDGNRSSFRNVMFSQNVTLRTDSCKSVVPRFNHFLSSWHRYEVALNESPVAKAMSRAALQPVSQWVDRISSCRQTSAPAS
jgi:hypothetical protein